GLNAAILPVAQRFGDDDQRVYGAVPGVPSISIVERPAERAFGHLELVADIADGLALILRERPGASLVLIFEQDGAERARRPFLGGPEASSACRAPRASSRHQRAPTPTPPRCASGARPPHPLVASRE